MRFLFMAAFATALASMGGMTRAQEVAPSPTAVASASDEDATKRIDFASPDGKFAFLLSHAEYDQTIDLIDKKTEKVVQHIDDQDMSSVNYRVLWAPDSKRFALMTRIGHPNQAVEVFFQKGNKFEQIKLPKLTAEIPARIRAGKEHPHVANNNWQTAEKWNKDGSLLVTIDNMIDGAGHTASATRTVVLGFDKSGQAKILKSTVKYESRND
jgi:WD40 repeat protein